MEGDSKSPLQSIWINRAGLGIVAILIVMAVLFPPCELYEVKSTETVSCCPYRFVGSVGDLEEDESAVDMTSRSHLRGEDSRREELKSRISWLAFLIELGALLFLGAAIVGFGARRT